MKTKVKVKFNPETFDLHQLELRNGAMGYIDGYVFCRTNNQVLAVVISGSLIDAIPIENLEIIE